MKIGNDIIKIKKPVPQYGKFVAVFVAVLVLVSSGIGVVYAAPSMEGFSFAPPFQFFNQTLTLRIGDGLSLVNGALTASVSGSSSSTFATTSADFWMTQKSTSDLSEGSNLYYTSSRDIRFSTTSADFWCAAGGCVSSGSGFSTTSTDFWKTQNSFFSTTSGQYFVNGSTTIPKIYTANSFSINQTFTYASSTQLGAQKYWANDGTAAAPSYTFGTNSGTGVYLPSTAEVGLSASGVERFSSGSVYHARIYPAASGIPFFIGGTPNMYLVDNIFHHLYGGSAPAISSCGTNPSLQGISNDSVGHVRVGTGAINACTLTFNKDWSTDAASLVAYPSCSAVWALPTATATVLVASTTSSTIVFRGSTSNMGGGVINYQCNASL